MTAPAALSDAQADSILDADSRVCVWEGSIRSGKTLASILRWLTFVHTAPPGPLAMIGRTLDTIGRNVLDPVAELLPAAIVWTRGASTARILGRLVHVLGANDARSEGKLRGLTLAGAYVDEASLLPEAYWTQLLGRLSVPGAQLFATTNPDSPSHWLKVKYLDRAPELGYRVFHFTLADNPGLTAEYVAAIAREFVGLWYKRFILGLWVAAEGAIYEQLDDAVHARPAPDRARWAGMWLGIDYGTSNPTHAVLLALDHGQDGHGRRLHQPRLHAVGEWRHDGRTQGQLTDAALSRGLTGWLAGLGMNPSEVQPVIDPSAASLRAQLRADGWAHLKAADNAVVNGLRSVSRLLDPVTPLLVIDEQRCPVLWRELQGYVWDPAAQARGEDAPLKVDDHGADALRYGVMGARRVWRQWVSTLAAAVPDDVVDAA